MPAAPALPCPSRYLELLSIGVLPTIHFHNIPLLVYRVEVAASSDLGRQVAYFRLGKDSVRTSGYLPLFDLGLSSPYLGGYLECTGLSKLQAGFQYLVEVNRYLYLLPTCLT